MNDTPSTDHRTDQDVVDVLVTDHREVAELIHEIVRTAGPAHRRDLADQLVAELVRHSVAEEMYVYPAIRDAVPGGEQVTEHDAEEHKQLERLMKQLESTDSAGPDFVTVVQQLQTTFQHHIEDEESEQFVQLRAHLSEDDLISLKGKVQAAKKVAPTRPHPDAPNAELFHKTLGAGVGMVDRLRDALSGRST